MSLKRIRNNEQVMVERIVAMIMEEEENSDLYDYSSILHQVHEQLKNNKKKKSENSLTKLSGDEWLAIYSFIGVEHLFYNQIFRINHQTKEKIYENCLFWQNCFNLMWKCSTIDEEYDWIYLRKCCFHKFNSFHSQKQENPHYISAMFNYGRIGEIKDNYYENKIDQLSHVLKVTPLCYCIRLLEVHSGPNYLNFAEIGCQVNIYLKEKPICVNVSMKGSVVYDGYYETKVELKAKVESGLDGCSSNDNEWIQIFSDTCIPIVGIIELFNRLKLDETVLENAPSWESIKVLRKEFPEAIRQDKHFLWFCDSILSQLPYPFEIIFREYPTSYYEYLVAGNEQEQIQELLEDIHE